MRPMTARTSACDAPHMAVFARSMRTPISNRVPQQSELRIDGARSEVRVAAVRLRASRHGLVRRRAARVEELASLSHRSVIDSVVCLEWSVVSDLAAQQKGDTPNEDNRYRQVVQRREGLRLHHD